MNDVSPKTGKDGKEIQFKALTEGLGFHPFANGLPYAPVSKAPTSSGRITPKPMSMGLGAVAAGAPTFASPRVQVPVVASGVVSASVAHAGLQPARTPLQRIAEQAPYRFDYPIKRALAFLIDAGASTGLGVAALVFGLWKQGLSPSMLTHSGVVLVTTVFLVFFGWALLTAQEIAFGTSLGKRIFGLQLNGTTSGILLRALVFLPSFLLGLGVAWGLFDSRKRCWHDLASGIQPDEIARL